MHTRAHIQAATENRDLAEEAFHILHYNQELVQFADNKAGTLIVINSLFIAAVQALRTENSMLSAVGSAAVVLGALAIFFCFSVVTTRFEAPLNPRNDLIFFADITKRSSPEQYAAEFFSTQGAVCVEDTLRRAYVVASIAQRKFAAYGTAQFMTGLAGAVWVLANVLNLAL
ncbi:MAG: Pycsar system effector family protein [Candidatus Eremiobacterota bacterium]